MSLTMKEKSYTDLRGMDITMLRTFDALLRERNVSRAGARLFLSQPAVSACLKRLRETFGDELFTRSRYGVVPTPRALSLAPRVEAVLSELQKLLNSHEAFDPGRSDRILRIAGSDYTCRTLLPALCRCLSDAGSSMKVSWELADFSRVAEQLSKNEVDVALVPRITQITGVQSALLCEDSYVCVANRGHPILDGHFDLDRFSAYRHIVLGQTRSVLDDTIDEILARSDKARQIQVAVASFSQMADLLTESDLISVFPKRVAEKYARVLGIVPLPFDLPSYRLHLCWHRKSDADPAIEWLREQICQAAQVNL